MPFAFLYIYIYPFLQKQKSFNKTDRTFYRAEAIKFILTMVLSLLPSNGYSLSILLRFCWFLLALVLNNIIPLILNKI